MYAALDHGQIRSYLFLGLLQGAVFVTRRARVLLESSWLVSSSALADKLRKLGKLAGWEHATSEEIMEYTREFDQATKLIIKSDQEPAYVRVGSLKTRAPKYNISFGKLKLTG